MVTVGELGSSTLMVISLFSGSSIPWCTYISWLNNENFFAGTGLHKDEISLERLQNLAAFQTHLLSHALSHPSAQEVVYSTCSLNTEENEEVVQSVLSQCENEFELENLQSKLQGWKHFGRENYGCGKYCLRTVPEIDKCHGFFVAKFIRKKPDQEYEFQLTLTIIKINWCKDDNSFRLV